MNIYYPSCNFRIMFPSVEKSLQKYLKESFDMKIVGCCLYSYKLLLDNTAIINCQACRTNLNQSCDNPKIKTIWEFLDEDDSFIFPNYHHQKMELVDCYRDRHQKDVHNAIRSLLRKMNIEVVERKHNRENADFCGIKHYEPISDQNKQLLLSQKEDKLSHMSENVQKVMMEEFVSTLSFPAITYCNTCTKSIALGGGEVYHLMQLLMKDYHTGE